MPPDVSLLYDEKSMMARKKRVKGTCNLKQREDMLILTSKKLNVPERSRKYYVGSNRGDCIAWLALPSWDSSWLMSFNDKKKVLSHPVTKFGPSDTSGSNYFRRKPRLHNFPLFYSGALCRVYMPMRIRWVRPVY